MRAIESTWVIAQQLHELTLYDAALLSVAQNNRFGPCPFWTADHACCQRARALADVHLLASTAE